MHLEAGAVIDGLGGYSTYGLAENADVVAAQALLSMGPAEGCTLIRSLPRDALLTYEDVKIPEGRIVDELRREQDHDTGEERFGAGGASSRGQGKADDGP
jgi:predicted homoserine dehydrogenase-like protein